MVIPASNQCLRQFGMCNLCTRIYIAGFGTDWEQECKQSKAKQSKARWANSLLIESRHSSSSAFVWLKLSGPVNEGIVFVFVLFFFFGLVLLCCRSIILVFFWGGGGRGEIRQPISKLDMSKQTRLLAFFFFLFFFCFFRLLFLVFGCYCVLSLAGMHSCIRVYEYLYLYIRDRYPYVFDKQPMRSRMKRRKRRRRDLMTVVGKLPESCMEGGVLQR